MQILKLTSKSTNWHLPTKVSEFFAISFILTFHLAADLKMHWFAFETKIRNIVDDLLSKPLDRIKQMLDRQVLLEETINLNKRRVDEHDFLLYKFQKRTDMEEEYEERITRVETDVKTQLTKHQATMADLTTKVDRCEKKEHANHDHIHKLDVKMDQYLSKLKDDVDKIAGKNIKLFNQFMDQMKEVDNKYEEHAKTMQAQQEFFEANKTSAVDNRVKMEQVIG